jgi:small-conductance mechanosensitive channel
MFLFWSTVQDAVIGATFGWIIWVFFSTLRRYYTSKARARIHEKLLERINSPESLVNLASSDSGRQFLDLIAIEESPRERPFGRVLFGVQAGMVLFFFGVAMLFAHHHVSDAESGFMILGLGAIGLGIGFLAASAASLAISHRLGLLSRERNG